MDINKFADLYNAYLCKQFKSETAMGDSDTTIEEKRIKRCLIQLTTRFFEKNYEDAITVDITLSKANNRYSPLYISSITIKYGHWDYITFNALGARRITYSGDFDEYDLKLFNQYREIMDRNLQNLYDTFVSAKKREGVYFLDDSLAYKIIAYYSDFKYGVCFDESKIEMYRLLFSEAIEDCISDILDDFGYKNVQTRVELMMPLHLVDVGEKDYETRPEIDMVEFSWGDKKYRYVPGGFNGQQTMFQDVFPTIYRFLDFFVNITSQYLKKGQFA